MKRALSSLSAKYGILLILFFINRTFIAAVIMGSLGGTALFSAAKTDDAAYALILLANDVISYAVPLAGCVLLFRKELDTDGLKSYERFPADTLVLFIFALSASLNCSYLFSLFVRFFCDITGISAPEKAFSSIMPQNDVQFIVFLFCSAVIAPVCEELIFRKYLVMPLRKYGDLAAILVSAVIFSLYHANVDQLVYTLLFGLVLALAAVRSGKILPLIIMHSANNIIVCFEQYYPENGQAAQFIAQISPWLMAVTYIVTYGGLLTVIPLIVKKVFRLHNNCELTHREQLAVFLLTPALIVGLALSVLAYFI